MSTRVRCKMVLNSVTERIGSKAKYDAEGKHVGYEECSLWDAEFTCVVGKRDDDTDSKLFWTFTPSGSLKLSTIERMPWKLKHEYYVDLIPVTEA